MLQISASSLFISCIKYLGDNIKFFIEVTVRSEECLELPHSPSLKNARKVKK